MCIRCGQQLDRSTATQRGKDEACGGREYDLQEARHCRERLKVVGVWLCGLTPELSRTAARNGGVVHVTMQPSREAVSA